MPLFSFLPNADLRNDGWSLVGTAVTALNEALNNDDDTKYVKAPASKAAGAIQFPVDTSSVPEGAVITSVTVKARLATGAGSAPAGAAAGITIGVGSSDDTSKYTTRTVYPSGSASTVEVATYQRDALGFLWDVHRLNFLYIKFWCFLGIFDLVRLYKLFCEIKYRVRPVVTVVSPGGTVLTPSPVLKWTYSQSDGDAQQSAEYKIFRAQTTQSVSFNPTTATPVYHGRVSGDITELTLPTSINSDDYVFYVRATSSFKAVSTWASKSFTVSGPTPGTPGVDDPLNPSGAIIAVVPDREQGSASISLTDTSNMMSPQAGDAESNIDGVEFTITGGTVSRDLTTAFPGGTASWKLTSTGTNAIRLFSDWIEVDQGQPITVTGQFRTASTARSTHTEILYYDENFTQIGSLIGSDTTDSTSTWQEVEATGDTPAGVVYARAVFVINTSVNTEVHNVDRLGLMYGTNTPWSDGGHRSRNLLSSWYSNPSGTAQAGESWVGGSGTSVTTNAMVGTGGSGLFCNKMTYNGLSPSIAFRAAGTAFTSPTSGTDYTLNKPAGVAAGDLMVAFVTSSEQSGTIVPPSGWTLASTSKIDDASLDTALYVLKRTAGGSEPSSWTDGTLSVSASRRTAIVVAYSGAADASLQFIADTSAQSAAATPLTLTTPSINNTDPNAWRISAFAVSDDTSGGTMTANRNAPSAVAQIQYVGGASQGGYGRTGYTVNKPAGVVAGDLMIATVTYAGFLTLTPPTGWTMVQHDTSGGGSQSTDTTITTMTCYRYATSSEPSSWTSGTRSLTTTSQPYVTNTVAYRNVHQTTPFIAEGAIAGGSIGTVSTPTLTNTNSLAWRVCSFAANTIYGKSSVWTTNEASPTRATANYAYGGSTVVGQMYDSTTSVGTGSHSRTATLNQSYYNHVAWMGILNPAATVPSAVSDETARGVAAIGASNPYMTTRVFDSAGVNATGLKSMTGIWSTGGGTDKNSMAGWFGYIRPASPVTEGYASAVMNTQVDVTKCDLSQLSVNNKVTLTAAFIGSTTGTPYLTAYFYRANQLLSSDTIEGTPFDTTAGTWTKSSGTFDVPEGTTRISMGVSVSDRQVGDVVYWGRSSVAYGTDSVYRAGTSRSTHSVWSKPQIQYADDNGSGYGDWQDLAGQVSNPPHFEGLSGNAYYVDHTVVPLTNRKYRARTVSVGLNGDMFVSEWGPESQEFQFEATNFWLKDIADPSLNMELSVKWDSINVTRTNTGTVFQPIGNELPVVLTEGYKGNAFELELIPVNHDDWVKLSAMLASGRTLFLQTDVDLAMWVRPIGDLSSAILATNQRRSNPLRSIKVGFIEVESEL